MKKLCTLLLIMCGIVCPGIMENDTDAAIPLPIVSYLPQLIVRE